MCTRRLLSLALVVAGIASLSACGSPEHTGSAFCAQLGKELPAIAQPMTTSKEVTAMVKRYERLLARSPLSIEVDVQVVTDLLRQAAKVDPTKADQVQKLADASYHANQSALNMRDWVKSTCAVDISMGVNIDPMRQPTTTTIAVATTVAPPTTPAATEAPTTVPPVATTAP